MTYWLINLPFLAIAAAVVVVAILRGTPPRAKPWGIAAAIMMALTAVFDNAIIGSGLVAYDSELISGVMVGLAPIEDFAYTLAALAIVPALWHLLEPRESRTE